MPGTARRKIFSELQRHHTRLGANTQIVPAPKPSGSRNYISTSKGKEKSSAFLGKFRKSGGTVAAQLTGLSNKQYPRYLSRLSGQTPIPYRQQKTISALIF